MRLAQLAKDERRPRDFDPREYISTWTEKDLLHGHIVDAWVIIFRTRGCYWARASGCSMCGYVNDVAQEVAPADILHQVDTVPGNTNPSPSSRSTRPGISSTTTKSRRRFGRESSMNWATVATRSSWRPCHTCCGRSRSRRR